MYAGVLLFILGAPLLLGSWWGLLAGALIIVLISVRAVLEERMLTAELEGYAEYAERVRYRLVPRVW
jgi:protein-S-isoprenylcysteine O-methyltransferase Ste14